MRNLRRGVEKVKAAIAVCPNRAPRAALNGYSAREMVDILALVRLRKYLSGVSTVIWDANTDLDGDGTVGAQDLILLRKLLVGAEQ